MEVASVVAGQRRLGLPAVRLSDRLALTTEAKRNGLTLRSLYPLAATRDHRGHAEPVDMCAIGALDLVEEAAQAYGQHANNVLGSMLGYPPCCIQFFEEVWVRERWIDTTWKMIEASGTGEVVELAVPPQNNILLRYIGIRPVFHLPCSLHCEGTHRVADEISEVARHNGQVDEVRSLYELLSWPVQWSGLHGIAEIETPVFRISATTDATAQRHIVRVTGSGSSIEAEAHGNRFPFRPGSPVKPARRPATTIEPVSSDAIVDSLEEHSYYLDNGFRSRRALELAFEPIVQAIISKEPETVFHLSCKNGAMLASVAGRMTKSIGLLGVDPDPQKIARARRLLPNDSHEFWCDALTAPSVVGRTSRSDVCVVMIGRVLELPPENAAMLVSSLKAQAGTIVVYAFDDWLRLGTIVELSKRCGWTLDTSAGDHSSAWGFVQQDNTSA